MNLIMMTTVLGRRHLPANVVPHRHRRIMPISVKDSQYAILMMTATADAITAAAEAELPDPALPLFQADFSGPDVMDAAGKLAYFETNSRSHTRCCGREFFVGNAWKSTAKK